MNIDKDNINSTVSQLLSLAQRHALFLGIIGFSILYGYIIMQISGLSTVEPEQAKVNEQLKSVPRPNIDTDAVITIESLETQNINTQAIFNEARENPFSE